MECRGYEFCKGRAAALPRCRALDTCFDRHFNI